MNTTNSRKKSIIAAVGAAVAAAAAPAFLFAGAGTAQAYTGLNLTPDPSGSGVTVHINSVGLCLPTMGCVEGSEAYELAKAHISSGWCTYKAVSLLGTSSKEFYLEPAGKADLWFPGPPTATTWTVTVDCPKGTDGPTQQVVY